jgi:hypothetical protein
LGKSGDDPWCEEDDREYLDSRADRLMREAYDQ